MQKFLASKLPPAIIAFAVAATIVSAGCGGGAGSSSGTAGKAATTAQGTAKPSQGSSKAPSEAPSGQISNLPFARQVRAICARGKKRFFLKSLYYLKAHGGGTQPSQALQVKMVRVVILPELQSQVDQIRALSTPPDDEAKVEAFLSAMEEAIETSAEASGQAALEYGHNFDRSAELADEYGIHRCAYG